MDKDKNVQEIKSEIDAIEARKRALTAKIDQIKRTCYEQKGKCKQCDTCQSAILPGEERNDTMMNYRHETIAKTFCSSKCSYEHDDPTDIHF